MSFLTGMRYVYYQTNPSGTTRARAAFIDTLAGTAFPNSRRIYVHGSQADIRVPMREIQLSPTLVGGDKDNPGTKPTNRSVYDTSGPYGDPDISIDVRQGAGKAAPAVDRRA